MGVRILHDEGDEIACIYDSMTDIALGPVFRGLDAEDQARHFLGWLEDDARTYSPQMLKTLHTDWAEKNLDDEHGELTLNATQQLEASR